MDYQMLNLLFRCNMEFNHQKIRSHGLTDTECMICSCVYSNEGCSQDDVAKALSMGKTTAGKALQKLETKGLVIREEDPADRRKKVLRITEKGKKQISGVLDLHDRWFGSVLSCLSPEEQKQFESYCVRLLNAARALETKA